MVPELSLASLLTVLWAVVLVMALLALSHWGSSHNQAQSDILAILGRAKRSPKVLHRGGAHRQTDGADRQQGE
jgi:hypothetical protein